MAITVKNVKLRSLDDLTNEIHEDAEIKAQKDRVHDYMNQYGLVQPIIRSDHLGTWSATSTTTSTTTSADTIPFVWTSTSNSAKVYADFQAQKHYWDAVRYPNGKFTGITNYETDTPKKEKKMGWFSLTKRKRELEIAIETLELSLKNKEEASRQELANLKADHERTVKAQRQEHDLKIVELTTMTKLKNEQELAKQKLEYEQKVQALTSKHVDEIAKLKTDLAKEYYDNMTKAMFDLNKEGSAQTKFVQEMALTMMGKGQEKPLLPTQHTLVVKDVKDKA